LRAQLDKARATKRQKQLDLRCQESLQSLHAVSEEALARARTALTIARAEERLLKRRLAFTTIKAPSPASSPGVMWSPETTSPRTATC